MNIIHKRKEKEKMANTVIMFETEKGNIKAELYPEIAPITVKNFVKLVEGGFYDGLTFHRIINGFMIQGGDPWGNGMGGSDEKIKGEFLANGVKNDLKHTRGVLSMARSMDPNSASSQFFIMHADAPHLDGQYAAFGKVIEGIEVVDAIVKSAKVEDFNGTVLSENQPKINKVYVV
ncbi:MAG: peptidylprolyl isomerase [Ruminococcaceae bacterium]|nr:peptidylprolyl isomerase [Oscillospiraceae bacterium]